MRLLLVIACLILAGCAPEPRPGPRSGAQTRDQAILRCQLLGLKPVSVMDTGSMKPTFDENMILGVMPFTAPAVKEELLVFETGKNTSSKYPEVIYTVHRATDVNGTAAYVEGDYAGVNGWVDYSKVRYRVVALFPTKP